MDLEKKRRERALARERRENNERIAQELRGVRKPSPLVVHASRYADVLPLISTKDLYYFREIARREQERRDMNKDNFLTGDIDE